MERVLDGALSYAVFLFAVSLHEFAHALSADKFGDDTPRAAGRLTLNPLPHMNFFGTVLLPLVGLVLGGMVIGFASTPVQPDAMRKPRLGRMVVAVAGPLTNAALCIGAAAVARIVVESLGGPGSGMVAAGALDMLLRLSLLSGVLAVFNMLPVGPLDGAVIWETAFPGSGAAKALRGEAAWMIGLGAWLVVLGPQAFEVVRSLVLRLALGGMEASP